MHACDDRKWRSREAHPALSVPLVVVRSPVARVVIRPSGVLSWRHHHPTEHCPRLLRILPGDRGHHRMGTWPKWRHQR